MIHQFFEIIKITEFICISILFLVYPYFIFYFSILLIEDLNFENFDWYIYIPFISHFISLIMIVISIMQLLKITIKKYYKIKYNKITIEQRKLIDPYDEEDWDELEEGDIIYMIDKFMNINFEIYNGTQDINLTYQKLTRQSILKSLIKMRNRQINRNKLETEKIFRLIDEKKKELDKNIKTILDKGEVENSNRIVTLDDIENLKISEFFLYNILPRKGQPIIVKYKAKTQLTKESKREDLFLDDWWDEVEKFQGQVGLSLEKLTPSENEETLNSNYYFPQLKFLIEEGEIVIESPTIREQLSKDIKRIVNLDTKNLIDKIKDINSELKTGNSLMKRKLKQIEDRFPYIKKT